MRRNVVFLFFTLYLTVVLFLQGCTQTPTRPRPATISAQVNFTVSDNGTCIPNATIIVDSYWYPDDYRSDTLTTDADGKASVTLSGLSTTGKGSFHTKVCKDGYQTVELEPQIFKDKEVVSVPVNLAKVTR